MFIDIWSEPHLYRPCFGWFAIPVHNLNDRDGRREDNDGREREKKKTEKIVRVTYDNVKAKNKNSLYKYPRTEYAPRLIKTFRYTRYHTHTPTHKHTSRTQTLEFAHKP